MDIIRLLDTAKSHSEIPSDLQLAKRLGVSQTAVWKWRRGDDLPKPIYAMRLAELAGLNPDEVVAELLENSTDDPDLKGLYGRLRQLVAAFPTLLAVGPVLYIMLNNGIK